MLVRRVTFRKCLKKVDGEGGVSLRTRPGRKEVHPFDSSSIGEEAGCTLRRVKNGLIIANPKEDFPAGIQRLKIANPKEDFHTGMNSTPENCKSKRGFTYRNSRSSTVSNLQTAKHRFRDLSRLFVFPLIVLNFAILHRHGFMFLFALFVFC